MRHGNACALLLAFFAASIPLAAQSQTAEAFLAKGDYAGAARTARSEASGGPRHTLAAAQRWLIAAEANERAEGTFTDTDTALAAAVAALGPSKSSPLVQARIASIRALRLSRGSQFEAAARAILEAQAALPRGKKPEQSLELKLSYGIVLLRMRLAPQALGIMMEVSDARLDLPGDDPRLLDALHWLGVAQLRARKDVDAVSTLREVVRVRALALGPSHPDTLASRAALASALAVQNPTEAARERAEILAQWQTRADPRDAAWLADALRATSADLTEQGVRLATLRTAYRTAATAMPTVQRVTAETGIDLAKALYEEGRYGEALDVLTEAAARSSDLAAGRYGDEIQSTRAVLYEVLDRPSDAESIYRNLIAAYDADPTRSRSDRLTLLNNLAELKARQGAVADALPIAREVATGRSRLLGPDAQLTLSAKSALASYLSLSGKPEEAIKLHRDLLAARLAAKPQSERDVASSYHNLAAALDEAGHHLDALQYAERAVAVRLRVLGEAHPNTIDSLRLMAGLRFMTNDKPGAKTAYRFAVAALERSRLVAASGDRERQTWFRQYAQVYKMLATLEAEASSPSALAYVDAVHGRTLAELSESQQVLDAVVSPDDAARLRTARAAVGALAAEGPGTASGASGTTEFDAATGRLSALETELEGRYPALRFSAVPAPLERSRIRAAIGPGASLLTFAVLRDRVLRISIAPDNAVEASQLEFPMLAETVRAYLALLSAKALAGTAADPLVDRAVYAWPDGSYRLERLSAVVPDDAMIVDDAAVVGRALAKELLGGLPDTVRRSARWVVSPDGPIAALPFDTLEVDGHLIAEHTEVSYTPSIRMLLSLRDRQADYQKLVRDPMLVLGAPAFSTAPKGSPLHHWEELKGSAAEISLLRSRFDLTEGVNMFTGTAATERRLRGLDASGALGRARMLVFSTHGLVDMASAERNAVLLLGSGSDRADDGFVRAAELMSLRLRADLVVVSACESGVGEWLDGEGAMGLPFAMFAAGGNAAVLSRWSIADHGATAFFDRFFARVQQGERAGEALWHAKQDLAAGLAGERWRDPAYWAAFSLYGAD